MTDEQLDRMLRDADPYDSDVVGRLDGAEQTLLEEIMSVPTLGVVAEPSPPPGNPRRVAARRTAGVLTAAAVLAVTVTVPTVLRHRSEAPPAVPGASSAPAGHRPVLGGTPIVYTAAVLRAAEQNPRLLIDEPGWKVTTVYGFAEKSGTIDFVDGTRSLEMNWYPAAEYNSYHDDRLHVSQPERVTVDKLPGDLFRYSATDFAVMLHPRDGAFVELRTGGAWTRDTFDRVLADVVRVDVRTWLAALPPEIVTPDRVAWRAAEVLADIPLPPGFDAATLADLGTNDAYQFGAGVTGRIGCAWIAEWLRAKQAGDDDAQNRAANALRSSHRWRVLDEMKDQGGWSEVFWEVADDVAAGRLPADYGGSIGCR